MLKLFQSIFTGGKDHGRYPESLIEAAIERAVDGTDARLRTMPGYRRRLHAPVIHAADHVIAMVDSLPDPLVADSDSYGADARLATVFASAERMQEVFGNDPLLGEFRKSHPAGEGRVTALLLAERVEKNVMGMELNGELLRRDVPQVAVSFRGHRLVDPADSEEETRRQLKRRAFDHLLSLALLRVTEVQSERADLSRQRDLLRRKLRDVERGGWNFAAAGAESVDPAGLQADIDEVEGQLEALGADQHVLGAHLDIVCGLLADAEKQFWAEDISLCLDRMNIRRDAQDTSAREVGFQELHNARGARLVMLLLSIAPGNLPQREDFIDAAARYLN
jgi:hypothetical protein